jgi:hypothetical protein
MVISDNSGYVGMSAAQIGLNAAMSANPIGFIVTLLGLLVAAGVYVINNWEQVKLVGMNLWNSMVGVAQWAVNAYITYANTMLKVYLFAWDSIKFAGISIWDFILDAGQAGVNGFIGLIDNMIKKALTGINALISGANKVSKALGFKGLDNITFDGLGRVDFSGAKSKAVAPKWDDSFNPIGKVDFSGAKFSDDSIMNQTKKAQAESDKKRQANEDKLVSALKENTVATSDNTGGTDANTKETGKNTDALREAKSAEDIADTLLGRIDRHVYATT